jgi:hypothetical protein
VRIGAPGASSHITKADIDTDQRTNPPDRHPYRYGQDTTVPASPDPVPVLWHDHTPEIYYITSDPEFDDVAYLNQRVGGECRTR